MQIVLQLEMRLGGFEETVDGVSERLLRHRQFHNCSMLALEAGVDLIERTGSRLVAHWVREPRADHHAPAPPIGRVRAARS